MRNLRSTLLTAGAFAGAALAHAGTAPVQLLPFASGLSYPIALRAPHDGSGRLFVPDLTFGEHIEMGENIFFYMGEMQECYVIYWPDAPAAK